MAILKDKGGEIEVRILKPPFDSAEPEFFDEYAYLGVRETGKRECTRYISPETLHYAIHVTFKKGYNWEHYPRFLFRVTDTATKQKIISLIPKRDGDKCEDNVLTTDQVFHFGILPLHH
jgi:hypothetical protein